VALPWALALARRRGLVWLERRVWMVYAALPATPPNQVEREMLEMLFPGGPAPALTARAQQGLLHLHQTGCLPRRCGECPVPVSPELDANLLADAGDAPSP